MNLRIHVLPGMLCCAALAASCSRTRSSGAPPAATTSSAPAVPTMPPVFTRTMLEGGRAMIDTMQGNPPAPWRGVAFRTGESLDNVVEDSRARWREFVAQGSPEVLMAGMRLGFGRRDRDVMLRVWVLPDGTVRLGEPESAPHAGLPDTTTSPELNAAVGWFNAAVEHPECPFPRLRRADLPAQVMAGLPDEHDLVSEAGHRAESVGTVMQHVCTAAQQSVGPSDYALDSVYSTQRGQDLRAYVRAGTALGLLQGDVQVTPERLKLMRVVFTRL